MKKFMLTSALALVTLTGCAGREAHPVAVTQVQDATMSCDAIIAEGAANQQQARHLAGQADAHNATNVAVGVIGAVLFWPALFALDLTDYEKQEIAALQARDSYLGTLAVQHGCNKTTATAS